MSRKIMSAVGVAHREKTESVYSQGVGGALAYSSFSNSASKNTRKTQVVRLTCIKTDAENWFVTSIQVRPIAGDGKTMGTRHSVRTSRGGRNDRGLYSQAGDRGSCWRAGEFPNRPL